MLYVRKKLYQTNSSECRIRPVEFGCHGFVATSTSSLPRQLLQGLWSGRRSEYAGLPYGGATVAEKKERKPSKVHIPKVTEYAFI